MQVPGAFLTLKCEIFRHRSRPKDLPSHRPALANRPAHRSWHIDRYFFPELAGSPPLFPAQPAPPWEQLRFCEHRPDPVARMRPHPPAAAPMRRPVRGAAASPAIPTVFSPAPRAVEPAAGYRNMQTVPARPTHRVTP